jgi:hypothetical protein
VNYVCRGWWNITEVLNCFCRAVESVSTVQGLAIENLRPQDSSARACDAQHIAQPNFPDPRIITSHARPVADRTRPTEAEEENPYIKKLETSSFLTPYPGQTKNSHFDDITPKTDHHPGHPEARPGCGYITPHVISTSLKQTKPKHMRAHQVTRGLR